MLPIGAIIVDFDGTVCLHDVGVDLLERFGEEAIRTGPLAEIERAWEAGTIGLRDVIVAEAASLRGDDGELIAFAQSHCPLDPTFAPFAAWAAAEAVPLTIVSDGLYRDFGDVRSSLEALDVTAGPAGGEPCPGWRLAR